MSAPRITRIERIREVRDNAVPLWLVIMTDLISLMLAFFILLFATTQIRNATWIEASKSMRSRFGGEESITLATGDPGHKDAELTWDSVERDPGLDLKYLYSLVKKRLAADLELSGLAIRLEGESVRIELPMATSFKPGVATMTSQGEETILRLAPFLSQLSNTVELVGHADRTLVNEEGRFGSNWHLSLARAWETAEALRKSGYTRDMAVRGRGSADADLLPKNLPAAVRNERARRVEIRLHVLQP